MADSSAGPGKPGRSSGRSDRLAAGLPEAARCLLAATGIVRAGHENRRRVRSEPAASSLRPPARPGRAPGRLDLPSRLTALDRIRSAGLAALAKVPVVSGATDRMGAVKEIATALRDCDSAGDFAP